MSKNFYIGKIVFSLLLMSSLKRNITEYTKQWRIHKEGYFQSILRIIHND